MAMKAMKTLCLPISLWLMAAAAYGQDCDRACLEQTVDTYLDAVINNDPGAVRLSRNVRFTENAQKLNIGDGLWNTLEAKGSYRILVADADAGQVGFMGTIEEEHREPGQTTPALLALRLKVENGEISEIEQFVARDTAAAERVKQLTPHASFSQTIPTAARMSRADLIATANKYFTGMQRNDGKGDYPFADDCNRIENGMHTTNAPVPPGQTRADPATAGTYSAQWSCREQFESGLLYFVNRIRDRRFVAVDQERGLVLSFVFFDHSGGEYRHSVTPDGRQVTGGPVQPWTWYIAELFKIENGKLRQIEAFLQQSPYGMNSGWSSWEDGMSDRAQDVTFK
ncbi:MAG: hypothetical protein RQ899_06960 [Pseudomonadales bacterium]|nr:hypothetical protein [Pseudomonadales bacterium]